MFTVDIPLMISICGATMVLGGVICLAAVILTSRPKPKRDSRGRFVK